MFSATMNGPRIVSSSPGRARLHAACSSSALQAIEGALKGVRGIRSVRANTLTGNLLVQFDPTRTSADELLLVVSNLSLAQERPHGRSSRPFTSPRFVHAPAVASIVLALLAAQSPLQYLMAGVDAVRLVTELTTPTTRVE
jgi:hypothetical protein